MTIQKWLNKNTKSLKNKRVVITGATGGLGKEICFLLAKLGADITLAVRNETAAINLKNELLTTFPSANIDFVELDFSNIQSVDKCIESLKKYNGIDVLINNAGVYNVPIKKLDSGYNNIFQINFVYQYYLTKKLLPELDKKQNSIVVSLGSVAHNYSKTNPNDIDFSCEKKPSKIYGNSKRYLMFSLFELFKNQKTRIAIVHPGVTLTNMTNHYPKAINWLVKIGIKLIFPKPKKAVLSVLYGIFNPCEYHEWIGPKVFNVWGYPKKQKLKTCPEDESKQIFKNAEKIYKKL